MEAVLGSANVGRSKLIRRRTIAYASAPAVLALVYPGFVDLFNMAVGGPGTPQTIRGITAATIMLTLMFAVPLFAFSRTLSARLHGVTPMAFEIRTRRLAFAAVTAPSFYCFLGVLQVLLSSPIPDEATWALVWGAGLAWFVFAPLKETATAASYPSPALRVAHGVSGAIVLIYIAFHLTNHLFAWEGQEAHKAVMDLGRKVYRSDFVEPILVLAMLFQVASGFMLAWKWSAQRLDFYRTFQVATGFFLSVYLLAHMNSVFILARAYFGIDTGWDFATGAPNGLIHDAWSARLIPHYAIATFAVIGHLFAGLRVVMLAHGAREAVASRVWLGGVLSGALLSLVIMLAMCGMRLS